MKNPTTPPAPSAVDVGTRAPSGPELDAALFVDSAAQDAVKDAPLVTTPGMLANPATLPGVELIATRTDVQRATGLLHARSADGALAARATALRTGAGEDLTDGGLATLVAREKAATVRVEEAETARDHEKKRLDTQGAGTPAPGLWSLLILFLTAWGLTLLAPLVETPLIAAALSVVTRAESVWETWALAVIALLALLWLPHRVGAELHELRLGKERTRSSIGAIVVLVAVWAAVVVALVGARVAAADHERERVDTSAGGGFSTGEAAEAAAETALPAATVDWWIPVLLFAGIMVSLSVATCLNTMLSPAHDQLSWLRRDRALRRALAEQIAAEQALDTRQELLRHLHQERVEVARSWWLLNDYVLPRLGAWARGVYHQQLGRSLADADAFDTLRLVDTAVPEPAPLPDPMSFLPAPAEAAAARAAESRDAEPDAETGAPDAPRKPPLSVEEEIFGHVSADNVPGLGTAVEDPQLTKAVR